MINREIYMKDPSQSKLLNKGVATVNDATDAKNMEVLRYELETFVCKGQYEKGLFNILEAFLTNLQQSRQQPGVWVSGFYGSGKSHFMKMLRSLWVNAEIRSGSEIRRAREIAIIPDRIRDQFRELDNRSKLFGGLHAASGTLSSGNNTSVRLALLAIVFRSVGLPEKYPHARFVMWLKQRGIFDHVVASVESRGLPWKEAVDNLYVADELHDVLVELNSDVFVSRKDCVTVLNNEYQQVTDVSTQDMIDAIRKALVPGHKLVRDDGTDARIPLTIVALDELQQYIGDAGNTTQRALDVQDVVEACSKNIVDFDRFMFIGSGQTAMSGTTNIKKLEGRFTLRVELSDADVDTVIREVILLKKPDAIAPINDLMDMSHGEVSRQLEGTSIEHRDDDKNFYAADYPILPVRRRFWENALRVLDQSGSESQLRNQLSMVHKAIQSNLDKPLGNVVPADYLYFESADKLLQTGILPRRFYEETMKLAKGNDEERLTARICGTVYLINKLSDSNKDIGLSATSDRLADLLMDDLAEGTNALRRDIPDLADKCTLLMTTGDEYRVQTEESTAWNSEFQAHITAMKNTIQHVDHLRGNRVRRKFDELLDKKLTLLQGNSKVPRKLVPKFFEDGPKDADLRSSVCVWVRDGWSVDESTVRNEAAAAGNESPTVFVFVPKRNPDELRNDLMTYKAAQETLDVRGMPSSPLGQEAQLAMRTRRDRANAGIEACMDAAFSKSRVFQGGGTEVVGGKLSDKIQKAGEASLKRLYKLFPYGDDAGWGKVYEAAKNGDSDPLSHVGYSGEPGLNKVCKPILEYMSIQRTGKELKDNFERPPYGWSGDCVDGAIRVLLAADLLKASDSAGCILSPSGVDRKSFGTYKFRLETATLSVSQRMAVRGLFTSLCVKFKQNEEAATSGLFVEELQKLAGRAGGDAPKPALPDTSLVEEIRIKGGNEQLLAIAESCEELSAMIQEWNAASERIAERWPAWLRLRELADAAAGLEGAAGALEMASTIVSNRQLLCDPDYVPGLTDEISSVLRTKLETLDSRYGETYSEGVKKLEEDADWKAMDPSTREEILAGHSLQDSDRPFVKFQTVAEILETVRNCPVGQLADKVEALPGRFVGASKAVTKFIDPEMEYVVLQAGTFRTEEEIDLWVEEARGILKGALRKGGPVKVG
jgi:hypothetical protein